MRRAGPACGRLRRWSVALAALALLAGSVPAAGSGDTDSKIRFDLSRLDADGLYGPADGLRALSYEFCIPDRPDAVAEVRGIDPSVEVQRSRGRVGCVDGELLCIGHTHQPGYRDVLTALSRLAYVARIEQAFFE